MQRTTAFVLMLGALLVTSCAGTPFGRTPDLGPMPYLEYTGDPVESFSSIDIDGWDAISRTQLVVFTGINQAWLLTVWNTCPNLTSVDRIAIQSSPVGTRVSRLDKVLVGRDACPIREIRPIDLRQLKADRKVQRKLLEQGASPAPESG